MANDHGARIRAVNNNNDAALDAVRAFWNEHVDDCRVARVDIDHLDSSVFNRYTMLHVFSSAPTLRAAGHGGSAT